jgi:hypothetical protein
MSRTAQGGLIYCDLIICEELNFDHSLPDTYGQPRGAKGVVRRTGVVRRIGGVIRRTGGVIRRTGSGIRRTGSGIRRTVPVLLGGCLVMLRGLIA